MRSKKNPKIDTKNKYGLFLVLGFIFSLSLIISAFEWKSKKEIIEIEDDTEDAPIDVVIEEIPITMQTPPPEIPKIEQPEIKEVPDEEELEKEVETTFEPEEPSVVVPVEPGPPVIEAPTAPKEDPDKIFTIVEEQAQGQEEFYKYVQKNLKYPSLARRKNTQGRVYVQFVIEKDGSITDVKVAKGIGNGCDEEAMRVVKSAPRWKPAKQRGKPVRLRMTLPIVFKLK